MLIIGLYIIICYISAIWLYADTLLSSNTRLFCTNEYAPLIEYVLMSIAALVIGAFLVDISVREKE